MILRPTRSAADLQKINAEARRFGRALTDAEARWALREHKRIYFECALSDLTWNGVLMNQAQERLHAAAHASGKFFAATPPPAVWVVQRPDGKFWLQDGYHRVATAFQMGKTSIPAYREEI